MLNDRNMPFETYSLPNLLEVKISVETRYEGRRSDQQLCKWRVHIDEIPRFDIARCKFTKVHLVKTDGYVR